MILTQIEMAGLKDKGLEDWQIDRLRPEEAASIITDEPGFYAALKSDPAAWSDFEARVLSSVSDNGKAKDVDSRDDTRGKKQKSKSSH